MHLKKMPFQIELSDSVKCILTNVQSILFGDILGSSIRFFLRRLMFSCVHFALLRPDRSLFRFKLNPSVLYLKKKSKCHFIWRNFISKAMLKELLILVKASSPKIIHDHENPLFTSKLHYRGLKIGWFDHRIKRYSSLFCDLTGGVEIGIYLHINGI